MNDEAKGKTMEYTIVKVDFCDGEVVYILQNRKGKKYRVTFPCDELGQIIIEEETKKTYWLDTEVGRNIRSTLNQHVCELMRHFQ